MARRKVGSANACWRCCVPRRGRPRLIARKSIASDWRANSQRSRRSIGRPRSRFVEELHAAFARAGRRNRTRPTRRRWLFTISNLAAMRSLLAFARTTASNSLRSFRSRGVENQESQDGNAEQEPQNDDSRLPTAHEARVRSRIFAETDSAWVREHAEAAAEELTRVEGEFTSLKAQHEDLDAARKSLQDVIDAINLDGRKLFTDTLTAVRTYFQELFRKLFGGGQADIILENESDVLESGIEITARPPGKELRSLSLLSGGEKTLTAIALLLAIFRNKPSPFCILDEVDAALDEANTQRLANVLREFLDRSQFIVVTHKKRTMAVADRLWGVTMQESGISRLLPMRFEEWVDDEAAAEQAA
ncbi:MAG: AAA family ATPase [Gemmataceae bacterium]